MVLPFQASKISGCQTRFNPTTDNHHRQSIETLQQRNAHLLQVGRVKLSGVDNATTTLKIRSFGADCGELIIVGWLVLSCYSDIATLGWGSVSPHYSLHVVLYSALSRGGRDLGTAWSRLASVRSSALVYVHRASRKIARGLSVNMRTTQLDVWSRGIPSSFITTW